MSLELLINVGFTESAICTLNEDETLQITIHANAELSNMLYAYVINQEQVQYIGKTSRTLRNRLNGYARPGRSQTTNIRINEKIKQALRNGQSVFIYTFSGDNIIQFRGVNVNLAAGLEDDLIKNIALFNLQHNLDPVWNIHSNPNIATDIRLADILELEQEEAVAENIAYNDIALVANFQMETPVFTFSLNETYWNKPWFNVSVIATNHFAEHGAPITIHLMNNGQDLILNRSINRTANPNGTPRLYLGNEYLEWLHANFNEGDVVSYRVVNPNEIQIGA